MSNVIECIHLKKTYEKTPALKGVTFSVPEGQGVVGLLGSNGSGKTTLLKILTGHLSKTDGEALIDGKTVGVESKAVISYLSDAHSLNNNYKVNEQVEYYKDFFLDFDQEKALQMIEELDINPNQKIKTLSKGTKEKLSLILTLSRKAKLYLLDEPIAGVDPAAREYILGTILSRRSENSTLLISTHLISEIEDYLDYTIFLKNGEIVLSGVTREIKEREGKSIDQLFREIFRWM